MNRKKENLKKLLKYSLINCQFLILHGKILTCTENIVHLRFNQSDIVINNQIQQLQEDLRENVWNIIENKMDFMKHISKKKKVKSAIQIIFNLTEIVSVIYKI